MAAPKAGTNTCTRHRIQQPEQPKGRTTGSCEWFRSISSGNDTRRTKQYFKSNMMSWLYINIQIFTNWETKQEQMHIYYQNKIIGPLPLRKTHPHSILQVPTTQLASMTVDPKFVELTADVLTFFFKYDCCCCRGLVVLVGATKIRAMEPLLFKLQQRAGSNRHCCVAVTRCRYP